MSSPPSQTQTQPNTEASSPSQTQTQPNTEASPPQTQPNTEGEGQQQLTPVSSNSTPNKMFRNIKPRYAPLEDLSLPIDNSISVQRVTEHDCFGFLEKARDQAYEDYKEVMMQRRGLLVRPDNEVVGYDIPLVLALFQNDCKMSTTHQDMTHMCDHIARINAWTDDQAKRLFGWTPIKFDPWLMEFLLGHRRLRCFDMLLYVNTGDLRFSGDVLLRLLWPDKNLKSNPFNDYLTIACRRATEDGRMLLARLFFNAFAYVGTICSYLPDTYHHEARQGANPTPCTEENPNDDEIDNKPRPLITLRDIERAFENVLSLHYNTSTMPDQRHASNIDMVQGFNIVSEVTKIFIDHVHVVVEREVHPQQHMPEGGPPPAPPPITINAFDIGQRANRYLDAIVSELLAYLYARLDHELTSVEDYIAFCRRYHSVLGHRILAQYTQITVHDVPEPEPVIGISVTEDAFTRLILRIRDGEPAIGELRFSSATLQPVINVDCNIGRRIVVNDNVRRNVARRIRWTEPRERGSVVPQTILFQLPPSDFPLYFKKKNDNPQVDQANMINNIVQPQETLQSVHGDPEWLATSKFRESTHYNTKLRERVQRTEEEEDYGVDDCDSDNEHAFVPEAEKVRDDQYVHWDAGDIQEQFYKQLCSWMIHPGDSHKLGHINNNEKIDRCNGAWFHDFITDGDGKCILDDCTHATDTAAYVHHWQAYMILSVRATVIRELTSKDDLQEMRNNPARFLDDLYRGEEHPQFTEMTLDGVSVSQSLFHCNTSSDDPEFNMDLLDSLLGLTLCVAYLRRTEGTPRCPIPSDSNTTRRTPDCSNLFFMVIRKSYMQKEREDDAVDSEGNPIQHVHMRMSFSRQVMKHQGFAPYVGHTIHFQPICSLASELREYKALFRIPLLLESFNHRLFGNNIVKVPYSAMEVLSPPSNSNLTQARADAPLPRTPEEVRQTIEDEVDPGCLEYITNCLHHPDCNVDASHFSALLQSLRCIGEAGPNSSSMSFTQGPPGTGKTNNIIYLIGALLHHSVYGQANNPRREQINYNRTQDVILRNHVDRNRFKILVVASSNEAVDNILRRIDATGIPTGRGGFFHPSSLRIAKHDYTPPTPRLQRYTINTASRPYDRRQGDHITPNLRAKRLKADEVILIFSTCSASGGMAFKELNEKPDIIVLDEGAQTRETEVLVPVTTTTYQGPDGSIRRCHLIAVGDDNQLPALEHVTQMMKACKMVKYWKVTAERLSISLFERMIYHGRATYSFLSAQYRMHPAISRITSVPFYKLYFRNPLPIGNFIADFNQANQNTGISWSNYYPMMFIDTSNLPARVRNEEKPQKGRIMNQAEAEIVRDIIKGLYERFGHDQLDGQIAVIAPYRAQVERIETVLRIGIPQLAREQDRVFRDVKVCTVDSMQGSQRNIVITSITRSNNLGKVGFVRDSRRLNVSLSRARFLNIVIADYSTANTAGRADGYGIEPLVYIYNKCLARAENNGSCAAEVVPVRNRGHNDFHYTLRAKEQSIPVVRRGANAGQQLQNNNEVEMIQDRPSFDFSTLYPHPQGGEEDDEDDE